MAQAHRAIRSVPLAGTIRAAALHVHQHSTHGRPVNRLAIAIIKNGCYSAHEELRDHGTAGPLGVSFKTSCRPWSFADFFQQTTYRILMQDTELGSYRAIRVCMFVLLWDTELLWGQFRAN